MAWSILVDVLVAVLGQYLSALAAELAKRLLPIAGSLTLESPDQLRSLVRGQMLSAADTSHRPIVRLAVLAFMHRFNGYLVHKVWDELHARGLTPSTASQFTTKLHPEPVDPVEASIALGLELLKSGPAAEVADDDATREIPVRQPT